MPEKRTLRAAERDRREGKSPSTQAGEFVREEIEHIREGKHGVRSSKQAIAIGLSKARRAGVRLPAPRKNASKQVQKKAEQDLEAIRSEMQSPEVISDAARLHDCYEKMQAAEARVQSLYARWAELEAKQAG